ncbi:YutD-like domain-containing protein [Xylocopilactobacillus apicola]|uniref:DUF1027 domain-containing protein n=1 Tax=Xylocopilactobacillus apicola TaxID=2932184 RepID=A0AAU9DET5_9LACO|nr:YutD-like domain-containing protein [Xylocopilactobacillus apicola]BDR58425.1 hypothetical protein XA3_08660 [Xylocopilactobacillus apicola]
MEENKNTKYDFIESHVRHRGKSFVSIDRNFYLIVDNYKNSLDLDSLKSRYTIFFAKFDYIFGDWSNDQLRLTGFYEKAGKNKFKSIATCEDFLNEFCTFDCPYFLLKKIVGGL